jgi:hypothetical protein
MSCIGNIRAAGNASKSPGAQSVGLVSELYLSTRTPPQEGYRSQREWRRSNGELRERSEDKFRASQ